MTVVAMGRIEDMQGNLIMSETKKLLLNIACSPETCQELEGYVVELVREDYLIPRRTKRESVYKVLVKRYNKSLRTMKARVTTSVLNVNLYEEETYKMITQMGLIVEEMSAAEFINALAYQVIQNVEYVKSRGYWVG